MELTSFADARDDRFFRGAADKPVECERTVPRALTVRLRPGQPSMVERPGCARRVDDFD